MQAIRSPRPAQEDKFVELHALCDPHVVNPKGESQRMESTHPSNNGDPFEALLENNQDVLVGAHKVRQTPRVPPVSVHLRYTYVSGEA